MDWRAIVEEVRTDRRRGATALARRALEAVALSRAAARPLIAARPSMPLIGAAVRKAVRSGVAAARRELDASIKRIAARAVDILPPGGQMLAFGGSGTVEAVVRAVKGKLVEGPPADVALVGADALLPGGDFVGAAGTADFLRRARALRCGVFVVASELKRVRQEPPLEKGFERVDGRFAHAVLSEKGLTYPPSPALPAVEPTWLARGALDLDRGHGKCHPHH
ncbi:MAG TPA: hypothetical protein VEJ18_11140 [Planctomycetota bacterium]|nr:hypothetical protein [Planctomycetota bacterium]